MLTTMTERDDFAYSDHLNVQNIPHDAALDDLSRIP